MPPSNESKEVIPDSTKTGPITDDELEDLSEEERAALQAEDDDSEALAEVAGKDDAADDAADEGAADKSAEAKAEDKGAAADEGKKADVAAEGKDKPADDAEAAEQRQAAEPGAEDEEFTPVFKAAPPEKYEERVKSLDERYDAAVREYNDNKITLDDMLKEHRAVDTERRALEAQKIKHEISTEYGEQTAEQLWQRDVSRFIAATAKAEGIDYNKPSLNAALDAQVKILANDKANADKDGKWFLEEAHKRVKEDLGLKASPQRKEADEAAKKAAEEQRRKAAAAERGKAAGTKSNLSNVPAASAEETRADEGEFAHLDGLDGMELENAVARMSAEQQERWARQ